MKSRSRRRCRRSRLGERSIVAIRSGADGGWIAADKDVFRVYRPEPSGPAVVEKLPLNVSGVVSALSGVGSGHLWIGTEAGEVQRAEWSGTASRTTVQSLHVAAADRELARGARLDLGPSRGSPGASVARHAPRPWTNRTGLRQGLLARPAGRAAEHEHRGHRRRRGWAAVAEPQSRAHAHRSRDGGDDPLRRARRRAGQGLRGRRLGGWRLRTDVLRGRGRHRVRSAPGPGQHAPSEARLHRARSASPGGAATVARSRLTARAHHRQRRRK